MKHIRMAAIEQTSKIGPDSGQYRNFTGPFAQKCRKFDRGFAASRLLCGNAVVTIQEVRRNIFCARELLQQQIRFYCSLIATSVNRAFMGCRWGCIWKRATFCEVGGVFTSSISLVLNKSWKEQFVKTASLYERR